MTNPTQAVANALLSQGTIEHGGQELVFISPDEIQAVANLALQALSDAGYVVVPKAEYESLCLHDESEVVVPIELTEAMIEAAVKAVHGVRAYHILSRKGVEIETMKIKAHHKAVIQAAQQQSSEEAE